MFPRSLLFMSEFSYKHSGAKSNNLQNLRNKLDPSIKLPESACIPFQMAEYTLGLNPSVKAQLNDIIGKIKKVRSVKKMNKMLH